MEKNMETTIVYWGYITGNIKFPCFFVSAPFLHVGEDLGL